MKSTISKGGVSAPNPYAGIDAALRARCHARFPNAVHFAPIVEPEPVPQPLLPRPPWELIREVLDAGMPDGLDTRQLAGGIYATLVAEGLISEGRA